MNKKAFLDNILPGNYFITKSMELTKSKSAGTLWYTKKFIVLYNYIFLSNNITTLSDTKEIIALFNNYITSLPLELQEKAKSFFYSSKPVADLRSTEFKLFGEFAGQKQFSDDNERQAFYESAKKYYFAFLMESGGQSGVKAYIKDRLYQKDFVYSNIDSIIDEYAIKKGYDNKKYKTKEAYIAGMRNDYMAFVRNERQILFYYGFFHSKSSGSKDREFSSLTPVGDLALHSNYYELIALWEHQKIKMLSQPVNIEIGGIGNLRIEPEKFSVNIQPYFTILQCLNESGSISNDVYQYIISRLPAFSSDGLATDEAFLNQVKQKVKGFHRTADVKTEDFRKELLKYTLGIRNDLKEDGGTNPLGLCEWTPKGIHTTDKIKLRRMIDVYTVLCEYKEKKYGELFNRSIQELKRQYTTNHAKQPYSINPKIKIEWDMYNIHADLPILLAVAVLLTECKEKTPFNKSNVATYVESIMTMFPYIIQAMGLKGKKAVKKEIENILLLIDDKQYEIYMNSPAEEYEASLISYSNESLADLEKKIKDHSSRKAIIVDGIRKRNMTLISLIKSYDILKYSYENRLIPCECCGQPTFFTYKEEPYLEFHHLIPFGDYDGPDHYQNILALCPMCHRKLHYMKQTGKRLLYDNITTNSYSHCSVEKRMAALFAENKLKSYQIEFLLADNAIDESAYNRILRIA